MLRRRLIVTDKDRPTRILTELDFNKMGKQIGFLHLPYSPSSAGHGMINIPMTIIRNGDGPTVLLMAGNHGDEYEGQVTLVHLMRDLEASDVQGRIIILPAANLPAAVAGSRISPLDAGNLNRAFPGNPDTTPTWQIAHYIDAVLLPMCTAWLDLHSGGSALDFLPLAELYETGDDKDLDARGNEMLLAFGAPRSVRHAGVDDPGFAQASGHRRRVPCLGTELGGSGSVNLDGVRVTRHGVLRVLAHLGALHTLDRFDVPPANPTKFFEWGAYDNDVYAPEAGLFEPVVRLGDMVSDNQLCGYIHFIENPGRNSVPVHFKYGGFLICLRHSARVAAGNLICHTVTELA
jgi:predicted deacylase